MTIAYRDARVEDAVALADFATRTFVAAYRDQMAVATLENYATDKFTSEALHNEIAAERGRFFVAEDAGAIVGYALVTFESFPHCEIKTSRPAEVERIYVDGRNQGTGIGRELLGRCTAAARAAGCDVVWLAVWEANTSAISFYLKSGFAVAGEQPFRLGDEVQRDFVMAWPDRSRRRRGVY